MPWSCPTAYAANSPRDACAKRAAYAGAPLHAALEINLPTPGVADTDVDAATRARLDAAFEATLAASHSKSMGAAVAIAGQGLWHREQVPEAAPLLFWASVGKTFAAVVALQLVAERRLALEDPVARWIADVPNGERITIRDLLAHTSGLYSANEDPQARAELRYRSPREALEIARRHGPLFCPGANWRYTNTGYDLLGEVIARIDQRSIDEAITARIIRPLGLRSMRALPPGGGAAGVAPLASSAATTIDPSFAGAAGPIVSDATDMLRFWSALLGGRLLPTSRVREMFATLYPMFDPGTYYGLGVMLFDVPDRDARLLWLGHAGGTPGASAIAFYSPADQVFVAVALTGDGPAAAVANQLVKAVRAAREANRQVAAPRPAAAD
ncbi:MAG: serine hydrolase domain-containing protein [Steroidobacteraceae bacterium]